MDQNFIQEFINRATAAGMSKEAAEQFITENLLGGKTAEQQLEEHISGLLAGASVVKSAHTVAYVEGLMKAAVDNGADIDEATHLAKIALNKGTFPRITENTVKQASASPVAEQVKSYVQGFLKSAMDQGFSKDQSVNLLKQANPELFKQLQGALSNPAVQGGLGGAAVGGASGYLGTENPEDKGQNALIAALLGGGLGAGAGELLHGNPFGGGPQQAPQPQLQGAN